MNLREHIATEGLKMSIEGNYGLSIELTTPSGNVIKTNVEGEQLKGQVLYDREGIDPETGDLIVIGETRVTIRRSALAEVPNAGETWNPDVLTSYIIDEDQSGIDGQSVGFITLKLKQIVQS